MALKIRMRKQGRKNRPFYRVVLTECRAPREGKYIELLGWYNPLEEGQKGLRLSSERIVHWIENGAILTEKVEALVRQAYPDVIDNMKKRKRERNAKLRQKRKDKRDQRVNQKG